MQHEPVQTPEKRGKRLAAPGRSEDQGIFAPCDRRPAETLWRSRLLENSAEPGRRHRVKKPQNIVSRRSNLLFYRHGALHQG